MNLLYIAGRYPKTSESFVRHEVMAQLEAGHSVRVVSLRHAERMPPHDVAPAPVVTVPRPPLLRPATPNRAERRVPEERWSRKVYAAAAARWIVDAGLHGYRPELIHAHFANLPTLVAGHVAARLGVPYTFIAHATDYQQNMSDDLLRRRVLHADAAFVISHAAKREIADRAGLAPDDADALHVVRASCRALVKPMPTTKNAAAAGLNLISVARHVPMKGLDLALRAFARLRQAYPHCRYELVGDGPESNNLRSLAARLGLDDAVKFHGRLDNAAAQQMLATADIAVLPCRRDARGAADGLPVFLMEAGALGIPVVTTAVGGIPELVVDGEGGFLVPVDDVDALTAALARLASDAPLRHRLGDGLRVQVRDEFTAERQIRRLHEQWERVLHDHMGPAHRTATADQAGAARPPVSIVVVARDEAATIERFVRHAQWADEVLVAVDTATTDDTGDHARAAGATVRSVEWKGFSATKNDAVKLARYDWVLSLDADEIVSRRLRDSVLAALDSRPDPRHGFAIERRSDFLGALLPNDTRAATRRNMVRLFHRAHGRWDETMTVHEVVRVPGAVHRLTGIVVQWRGFDLDELLRRFNGYATAEARQLARNGRRARAVDVLLRPIARFCWHYAVRGEFRLGGRGLVHSGLKAASEYMRWAKLWELERPSPSHDGLERSIRDH